MVTGIKRIFAGVKWRFGTLVCKKLFPFWQSLGFHIIRNHYEEPIPDTRTLKSELWLKQSDLVGIKMNEEQQLNLLREFSLRFKDEYNSFPSKKTSVAWQYYIDNGYFESVDGEIYYCMIRYFKPKRIFEIGAGYSTYLAAQAVLKNKQENGFETELIAFEPFPNDTLKLSFPGLSKLVITKIEDVELSKFNELKENDILFIDSSHVLRIGGDVQYEFLEILPRLNKGVIVHIHDIFLPAEYPKERILKDYIFSTEQYILQAFLAFNNNFEVLWGGSYMHLKYPAKLEAAFSSYRRNVRWPGSFWIRKVR